MQEKPFSNACEKNKEHILDQLTRIFNSTKRVLEIGSGTGQHSVHFAKALSHLEWQASDRQENLPGIHMWHQEFPLENLLPVIELDVQQDDWPTTCDAAYTANTFHIMPWELVQLTVQKVGQMLPPQGLFAVYGPFNYGGEYTSDSNRQFDIWLAERGAHQAIRHFEEVDAFASKFGLNLLEDNTMPANNRLIVWQKG